MSNYNLFPDADKNQVTGGAITASSTRINGGTSQGLGSNSFLTDSAMTDFVPFGEPVVDPHGSVVVQGRNVFGAFQTAPVTITSVADNGSGFCRYTLVAHGLTVGTTINVTGSTAAVNDAVQKITAAAASTFDTDEPYVAAATAGDYTLVAGRFASMTPEEYVMLAYRTRVAWNGATAQHTATGFGADFGIRRSIHKLEHLWTRLVATAIRAGFWHIYDGVFTTAPGNQDDATLFGTDDAANPTRAIPGELVYRTSGQQDGTTGFGVTEDDYEEITGH